MVDLIALIVVFIFLVVGYFKGVVAQLSSIAGFVVVYFFARPLGIRIEPLISEMLGSSSSTLRSVSIACVAVILYLACRFLGSGFESLFFKNQPMKSMNRMGGIIFGAVKGLCVVGIIFYLLGQLPQEPVQSAFPKLSQSKLYSFTLKQTQKLPPLELKRRTRELTKQPLQKASLPKPTLAKPNEKIEERISEDQLENVLLENHRKSRFIPDPLPKPSNKPVANSKGKLLNPAAN